VRSGGGQLAFREQGGECLRVAMHDDVIVAARRDAVDFLDLELHVRVRVEVELRPQAISLDEAGRVYLLALVRGRQHLAIVTDSKDVSLTPLPEGFTAIVRPPVIGPDHRVYLLGPQRVISLGAPDGSFDAPGRVAGATVTNDGLLLSSARDSVVSLRDRGAARTVARVVGDEVTSPAILGPRGELLFTTRDALREWRRRWTPCRSLGDRCANRRAPRRAKTGRAVSRSRA
jgi:hypothetical protein